MSIRKYIEIDWTLCQSAVPDSFVLFEMGRFLMDAILAPAPTPACGARQLDAAKLISLCAQNLDDHGLWTEFLRRFSGKIKLFIRGTLRRSVSGDVPSAGPALLSGATEKDLFQNVIVRLVDNGCAALKRFTGSTEEEALAYFAVIARSTVRDSLRRQRALKRPRWQESVTPEAQRWAELRCAQQMSARFPMEREILARELEQLSMQVIRSHSGEFCERDHLIFRLYFYDGLSAAQISKCKGIDLTRTGVERALDRLKERVRSAAAEAHATEVFER